MNIFQLAFLKCMDLAGQFGRGCMFAGMRVLSWIGWLLRGDDDV